MTRLITFFFRCPKGHGPLHKFEVEELRRRLDAGELRFSCITCDESWPATQDEINNARMLIERPELAG